MARRPHPARGRFSRVAPAPSARILAKIGLRMDSRVRKWQFYRHRPCPSHSLPHREPSLPLIVITGLDPVTHVVIGIYPADSRRRAGTGLLRSNRPPLKSPIIECNCDRGRIPGMAPISFPECSSDDVVLHLYSSRSLGRGLEDLVDGRGRHPWPLLPGRQLRGTLRSRPRSRSRVAARQWDPASWRGGRHYRDRRAACDGVYRRLTALLREAGCRFERQGKGSHEIWFSPITQRTFTVPSNIRNPVLANAILKQAGLPNGF